jgi:predicted SAM-dependent methyltransferase
MNILSNLKKLVFYRQHPETALRYLPIVDLLRKERLDGSKILEVGSGSYGIAPYLKKEITGVDTSFDEPEYPLLKQVKSSGEKIPFEANSFDVVILSDVLEHIPKAKRESVLNESIRVSKKLVIVSGPFGKDAATQDKKLADYSMKTLKKMHPYFEDHLKFGLPEIQDIEEISNKNKKVEKTVVVGHFLNLNVREWLMKYFITDNKLTFYFYLKGLMLVVPILKKMNNAPTYRCLIKIKLK